MSDPPPRAGPFPTRRPPFVPTRRVYFPQLSQHLAFARIIITIKVFNLVHVVVDLRHNKQLGKWSLPKKHVAHKSPPQKNKRKNNSWFGVALLEALLCTSWVFLVNKDSRNKGQLIVYLAQYTISWNLTKTFSIVMGQFYITYIIEYEMEGIIMFIMYLEFRSRIIGTTILTPCPQPSNLLLCHVSNEHYTK